jgi:hypothetical protein
VHFCWENCQPLSASSTEGNVRTYFGTGRL